MTPKEKAKELTLRFIDVEMPRTCSHPHIDWEAAKQCALICVEEIYGHLTEPREFEYWSAVKSEIESL